MTEHTITIQSTQQ